MSITSLQSLDGIRPGFESQFCQLWPHDLLDPQSLHQSHGDKNTSLLEPLQEFGEKYEKGLAQPKPLAREFT